MWGLGGRKPQQRTRGVVPDHVTRQPLVDSSRQSIEAHHAVSHESARLERPNELDVGVDQERDVVLHRCGGRQLDDLLQYPASHRRKRPAEIEGEICEGEMHERARQEVRLAVDMGARTGEPGEKAKVLMGNYEMMVDG